jgi:hypothetical protein
VHEPEKHDAGGPSSDSRGRADQAVPQGAQEGAISRDLVYIYGSSCASPGEADVLVLVVLVLLQRYFFLFNDLLLYGVANPLNRTYIIHRTISLLAGRIIPVDDSEKVKNGFKIISKLLTRPPQQRNHFWCGLTRPRRS